MTRIVASLMVVCAAFGVSPLTSSAALFTVPTDLNPGDTYRLAFVTSARMDATSTDIADYNSFVSAVAAGVPELAALGTTWKAIGSTSTIDARDNTGTNPSSTGAPIYRLDDTRIANNNADLWDGSILAELNTIQSGRPTNTDVWTGTDSTGIASTLELGASPLVGIGSTEWTTERWIFLSKREPATELRVYAMSAELTVPAVVPEPTSLIIWSLIGMTVGAGWWRRRQPAG